MAVGPEMPATFVLSIDLELAWGEFYRRPVDLERMEAARAALPRLLRLLERHAVPATFAVVGHLLLEGCDGHPEMPRPNISWRPGDWYAGDPHTDEQRAPAWYAPSLVRRIASAAPGHDVGAHGFSHVPFDDPGVSEQVAVAELDACATVLREGGHAGLSFVFPRNGIKYTKLLKDKDFRCYRGVEDRSWTRQVGPLRRLGHLADQVLAVTPPTGSVRDRNGALEVPSSMLFWSREGFRRWVPMATRVRRAERGVERAVSRQDIFHVWLHAEDLVPDPDEMLAALEAVLVMVHERAARGEMVIATMAGLSGRA